MKLIEVFAKPSSSGKMNVNLREDPHDYEMDDDYDVDKLSERYYQHLIDALFQENYEKAWDLVQNINTECYEQIGDILWRISVEAPDEQFREFLTLHKDQFLYDLLYAIKDMNYVNVREIFKVFKRAKLDWPELTAIEKSLRADNLIEAVIRCG